MNPLAIVDAEFRAASLDPAAPPTRFYVNLSERCQLRCAHCITDAPRKTADGTARDMSADVVAALAPHLAHAAYVGLVHAGEPMLAPQFEPFLEAVRRERRSAPTVVHLLTNGMAMTADRFARIVELGVTSLSFSLDGMSAASNDVLRIGARADLLLERIRSLSASTRSTTSTPRPGATRVRMGIAWVITRANVDEVPALIRFARDAGLAWVKLEELFPASDVAKSLALDRYGLDVAVATARALGDDLGVPVLDHTRAMTVWRCRLHEDPRMKRRATLDDLVNRTELNACRAPWETVCVEPNGDVKPLSFHHPVAGNLMTTSLDTIWRGDVFTEMRRTTRATRLCGAGPTTCAADPGPAAW